MQVLTSEWFPSTLFSIDHFFRVRHMVGGTVFTNTFYSVNNKSSLKQFPLTLYSFAVSHYVTELWIRGSIW